MYRIVKQYRETGSVEVRTSQRGRKPKLSQEEINQVKCNATKTALYHTWRVDRTTPSEYQSICEISCDLSVVRGMDLQEKSEYVDTILFLISHGCSKSHSLTVGLMGSKKIIARRLTEMKHISTTSRLASVLSLALAGVLTLSVVAGSSMATYALSPEEQEEVSVLLRKGTEPVSLTHKPFEGGNHSIYLPLRETLTAFGFSAEDITVDSQRSEQWEYYEQISKEFGAPGTILYFVTLNMPEESIGKRYSAFTFTDSGEQLYIPIWNTVASGTNAIPGGNAAAVDGVTYVPYSILEHIRSSHPGMLVDMNLTIQTPGCAIRLNTDINPYAQDEKAELTIERLTYLTQNHRSGVPFRPSDFAGFIPTRKAGERLVYDVSPTVSLEVTSRGETSEVWLGHSGENWSSINLGICSFDGYPWWGSDTWD